MKINDLLLICVSLYAYLFAQIQDLPAQSIAFGSSGLLGESISNPTSLDFGPNQKLYVSQQDGTIWEYEIERDNAPSGSGTYIITASNVINEIKDNTPNHNDDGSSNATQKRQVTGILATGTSSNPILYITSSDWRIGGGGGAGGNDTNLDTNSGLLSRLTWNGTSWDRVDLIRGLPRCEENHSTNGLDFFTAVDGTDYLLVQQGGNTNQGAPSNNFAGTTETYLSGAMLIVNLTQLEAMEADNGGPYIDPRNGMAYIYDLPTLNDPERVDITNSDNNFPYGFGHPMYNATIDLGDPFGGNNGLNQAFTESGGPLQIFAPGWRNAYDVVVTASGKIFTQDNGSNVGWGSSPQIYDSNNQPKGTQISGAIYDPSAGDYITNEFANNGSTIGDSLHYVGTVNDSNNTYYGGHPVPIRAFPSLAGIYKYQYDGSTWVEASVHNWADLIVNVSGYFKSSFDMATDFPEDPRQGEYLCGNISSPKVNILDIVGSSTNGICEYTATNFGGAMQGNILSASFNGNINRYVLDASGTALASKDNTFLNGFGSIPLDVIAMGDNDPFPGTIWAATYGAENITIFEPMDFVECYSPGDPEYDPLADYDGDGFTNEDEIANGTNPCSGGSSPNDNDGDFISDLTDIDDDNDGIPDLLDAYAIDANNGTQTNLPILYPFWNNDPGTGFFGLGFTGLMLDPSGSTDYLTQFDETQLSFGGAGGKATIDAVTPDDALLALNTQLNAFQFGVNVDSSSPAFTVHSRINSPFFNGNPPLNGQSYGIFIGDGDQDNYLKVALMDGSTSGQAPYGFEATLESSGAIITNTKFDVTDLLLSSSIDVYINVDTQANTAQPYYSLDSGETVVSLGSPINLPSSFLDASDNQGLAVGIISTSGNSATPYAATWDFMNVTEDQADFLATNLAFLDFGISNTGDISQLSLEVTNLSGPQQGPIIVTDINITGDDAALFQTNLALPLTIGVGTEKIIPVVFTPDGVQGDKVAALEITHTGVNSPIIIPLNATVNIIVPLFRINVGGSAVASSDAGPDWESNSVAGSYSGIFYSVNTGNITNTNGSFLYANRDSSIPDYIDETTFNAIFSDERWDSSSAPDMEFSIPIPNGDYVVNLFMGNSYSGTSLLGERVFDILLEGILAEDNLDLVGIFGHQVAGMLSYSVTITDNELNIQFDGVIENPLANAIEVIGVEAPLTLTALTDPLDFGSLPFSSSPVSINLDVFNNGRIGEDISISSINITGTDSALFTYDELLPVNVEPLTSLSIPVTFTSDGSIGTKSATLEIIHDATNSPTTVSLLATTTEFPLLNLAPIPDQFSQITESSTLGVSASGGDPSENVVYSISGQPAGLDIEPTNGQIFGVIDASALNGGPGADGVHIVTVTASKPGSTDDSKTFTWTVTEFVILTWNDKNENENYTPRHECSFVHAGDKFYLFGGREEAQTLDIYDYSTDTWNSLVNSAPAEFNHFQAVEYKGLIWVIGAFKTNFFPNELPADYIWIFNPATAEWIQGPEIPVGRRRGSAGLVVYNDKFYLLAGNTLGHSGGYVPWFDEYDPTTGMWTELTDAPRSRDHFHAAVINGKLYAASGRLTGGPGGTFAPVIAEVDVYDFATSTWSTLPPDQNIPTPRAAALVANFNDKLIVAGGETSIAGPAETVTEIYDPAAQVWKTGEPLIYPRHGTQAIVSGNGIITAAGSPSQGGGNQKNMEFYGEFNPTGSPSIASTLDVASTDISFGIGETKNITFDISGGNTGIIVKNMQLTGPDALEFSIDGGLLENALVGSGEQRTITISHNGTETNKSATLEINYNGNDLQIVDLTIGAGNNQIPVAIASADLLSGNAPLDVSFTGSASTDDTGIANYFWDFGDGNTSTEADPIHTFSSVGGFTVTLTVTDIDGLSDSATLFVNTTNPSLIYRVNAGGGAVTDPTGDWEADNYFTSGNTYSTNTTIANATSGLEALYQSERYGTMGYSFPVANGSYTVKLHFAEIYAPAADTRIFDVNIEGGALELDNYNIVADPNAGAPNTAVVKAFDIDVADGALDIAFITVSENPKISAIEIIKNDLAPQISIIPTSIDFGKVVVSGSPVSTVITLENTGDEVLNISAINLSGIDSALFSTDANASYVIPAGGFVTFNGIFTPDNNVGNKFASIEIISDDSNSPHSISLTGEVVLTQEPELLFALSTLDFGDQPVGASSAPQLLTITNSGIAALDITAFNTTGEAAGEYNVSSPSLPVILAPGESTDLSIVFTPSSETIRPATLTVESNDPAGAKSVPLTGTGISPILVLYRVNAGGSAVTDPTGNWEADNYFTSGNTYSTNTTIANATSGLEALYQSERYGTMGYSFPVTNGSYTVKLHFAEIYAPAADIRIFDVNIEGGALELDNYNIVADPNVGAPNTAVVKTFDIDVADGALDIAFITVSENPKISAIEIIKNDPAP